MTVSTGTHEIVVRVGFRKIEIKNNNFTINNQVILLNGVNHHDYHPKEGRCVTRVQMEADILLKKQHNINALRCSHYPANGCLYDLCDEHGLYVIDEADLECHGFEWVEPDQDPADLIWYNHLARFNKPALNNSNIKSLKWADELIDKE